MKKILMVLLVLAVMTAGVFAVDMPDAAGLKLSFLKNNTESYAMGWYTTAAVASKVGTTDLTAKDLSDAYGQAQTVDAFLGARSSYSEAGIKLSVALPAMVNTSTTTDTKTIGYTTTVANESGSEASVTSGTSLTNSSTAVEFATIPAGVKAVRVGVIKFTFAPLAEDIEAANAGDNYSSTVTVTMASK